uniref:Uncharacterized protein n=1 Tax=Anguilla anguilla TaxID=7936 RepID=A0A0E9PDY6_ANGAN
MKMPDPAHTKHKETPGTDARFRFPRWLQQIKNHPPNATDLNWLILRTQKRM